MTDVFESWQPEIMEYFIERGADVEDVGKRVMAKLLALAANGIEDANDDGVMLASVAFEIEGEIRAIADEVHPPLSAKETASLKRQIAQERRDRGMPQ